MRLKFEATDQLDSAWLHVQTPNPLWSAWPNPEYRPRRLRDRCKARWFSRPASIHPGEFLREILAELSLSQAALAQAIGVSPMRVSHVLNGSRPVMAKLALRLGRAFGQTPQYWLNLQMDYDLMTAAANLRGSLAAVRELAPHQLIPRHCHLPPPLPPPIQTHPPLARRPAGYPVYAARSILELFPACSP
ncbi:MAG: HigA family addiction module antitoxin [Methylococcaceae bacterium]|nr:HigA family addiction module antitoxin [Methylococcaceae bacterium]